MSITDTEDEGRNLMPTVPVGEAMLPEGEPVFTEDNPEFVEERPDRSIAGMSRNMNYFDLIPETPQTMLERKAIEEASQVEDLNFFEEWQRSFEIDTFTAAVWNNAFGETYVPEDGWQVEEQRLIADAEERGIPAHYLRHVGDSVSEAHYQAQLDRAQRHAQIEMELAAQGWTGFGTRMVTAILDPAALAIGAATEGAGLFATAGMTLSRAWKIARIGGLAALTEGSMEAYRATTNPEVTPSDVLYVAAFAFGLGGGVGALTTLGRSADELANDAITMQRHVEAGAQALEENPDTITLPGSGGAARNPAVTMPISETAEDIFDELDASELSSRTAQMDLGASPIETLSSVFGNSNSPIVRWLGNVLVGDQVGRAGGARTAYSAAEATIRFHHAAMSRGMNSLTSFYKQYKSALPRDQRGGLGMGGLRTRFYEDVTRQIRNPNHTTDAAVRAAADDMRTIYNDLRLMARKAGVTGFDEIDFNPNYAPRMFNHERIRGLIDEYGQEQLGNLVARAMFDPAAIAADPTLIKKGRQYIETLEKLGANHRIFHAQGLGRLGLDEVTDILSKELGMTADDVEGLAGMITGITHADPTKPAFGNARFRTQMDESYEAILTGRRNGQRAVRIDEMFENNMEVLLNTYTRKLSGWMALAGQAGIRSRADFDRLIRAARDTAGRAGIDLQNEGLTQLDNLQKTFDYITGVPLENIASKTDAFVEGLKNFQFARVMNQVGFAQAAEFGSVVGTNGWTAMLRHIPELLEIQKRAVNGQLEDDFLRDLETLFGFGGMTVRGNVMGRVDALGSDPSMAGGRGRLSQAMHSASRFTGVWSGLAPITDRLQQMAARLFISKLANKASKGHSWNNSFFNNMTAKRFAQLGIDEDMWRRIQTELQTPGRVGLRNGVLGRKVKTFDFDGWSDMEARDAFLNAVHREVRRQVQENDIGSMRLWMNGRLMSVILQFKGFMLNAFTKQLRHGLHMNDATTYSGWAASTLFAGLAYTLQTYGKSLGRDDAEEYREEMLSPKSVVFSGAIARSSYASMFPMLIDNALWAYSGGEQDALLFSHYRQSGQETTGWALNPTSDFLYNAVFETPGNIAGGLTGESTFTEHEARRITQLFPWQNAIGIQQGTNLLLNEMDLPERD